MKIEKRFLVLAIAIACGILAILLTNIHIKQRISQRETELRNYLGDTTIVLVAAKDIRQGSTIVDNMVGLQKIPANFAQPSVLTSVESALGKIAAVDIAKGEQVLGNKLTGQKVDSNGPIGSLATRTPAGKRAITISIDALSAVGGMVKPSDYVDIIGDFPISQKVQGKSVTQQITVTLFQNVLVLDYRGAAGTGKGGASPSTVTLALTPQEAAFLNYAQQQGKIRLILRPPLETETQTLPPINVDTFWTEIMRRAGIPIPSAGVPEMDLEESSAPSTVEIYRGSKKEELPLKEEGIPLKEKAK